MFVEREPSVVSVTTLPEHFGFSCRYTSNASAFWSSVVSVVGSLRPLWTGGSSPTSWGMLLFWLFSFSFNSRTNLQANSTSFCIVSQCLSPPMSLSPMLLESELSVFSATKAPIVSFRNFCTRCRYICNTSAFWPLVPSAVDSLKSLWTAGSSLTPWEAPLLWFFFICWTNLQVIWATCCIASRYLPSPMSLSPMILESKASVMSETIPPSITCRTIANTSVFWPLVPLAVDSLRSLWAGGSSLTPWDALLYWFSLLSFNCWTNLQAMSATSRIGLSLYPMLPFPTLLESEPSVTRVTVCPNHFCISCTNVANASTLWLLIALAVDSCRLLWTGGLSWEALRIAS